MRRVPPPWSAADFSGVAVTDTVRRTLSRMRNDGEVVAIGDAMVALPHQAESGLVPTMVLDTLTRRDGVRFVPTPLGAARALGLAPSVPPDGTLRVWADAAINGGRPVAFEGFQLVAERHGPRTMSWAGNDAATLVQALRHTGPTDDALERVAEVLASSPRVRLGIKSNYPCLTEELRDALRRMVWEA